MTKPITKIKSPPLIHHPSDVLDFFGHYDASNEPWLEFDENLSGQIEKFEETNRRFIRVRLSDRRHTSPKR